MKTRLLLLFVSFSLGLAAVGCSGGVQHPEPGKPNDKAYCANRDTMENNCMACSSLPGCGWCNEPTSGEASCQPGVSADKPSACVSGWAFSSEECSAPPLPPAQRRLP